MESPTESPASPSPQILPLAEIERRAIIHALRVCGTIKKAGMALGIPRTTLYRKMAEYGIQMRGGKLYRRNPKT